jgi:hypothetical protein
MKYNLVTNYNNNQFIKQKSKYYKVDLGHSITLESRTGDREPNFQDEFAYTYNYVYKTSLLKQGAIGDIIFYTDRNIGDDLVRFYIDREEFFYEFDYDYIQEKGIDGFLGYILKNSKEELENRQVDEDANSSDNEAIGDGSKIKANPGSVTYDDIKAYIRQQSAQDTKI